MSFSKKRRLRRILINIYHALNLDKLFMRIGLFDKNIVTSLEKFKGYSDLSDYQLRKDIKTCYYKYLTTPQEYFLFRFFELDDIERAKFLSDNLKVRHLLKTISEEIYVNQLCNKYNFYKLTSNYFKRAVLVIGGGNQSVDIQEFVGFTRRHNDLFAKPLSASFGNGAHVVKITNSDEAIAEFDKLNNGGEWIVEDRIIQSMEMSTWNESSVNTVRLPCFLSSNGSFHILAPVLRVGRKGSVVDNAGGGGIIACIDEKSGVITTNGQDEAGLEYIVHPDSNKKFKGWQVPEWKELMRLAEEIHRNCLSDHRYIGFDFALTDEGWVVIEGNWGQFLNQYVDHRGIKNEFLNYIH